MTATTSPAPLSDNLPPTSGQSWSLGVVPGSAPFRWTEGTLQLFIVAHTPFVFVPTTIGEYDRAKPVGTEWERRYTQRAVDQLNAAWLAGDERHDREHITEVVRLAQKETPYRLNTEASNARERGHNEQKL